ncbi:MAG: tripartite tricarboxylate transporter substrate binding protein [Pseudomonadota bacterium]
MIAILLLLGVAFPAAAEPTWPSRPIRFVVGFAPGGSADVLARWLADPVSRSLGQTVLVDNRAGAGGNVGMEIVATASPDGYTVGMGSVGAMITNQVLMGGKLPYDPDADLVPITQLASQPNVVMVNRDLPVRSMPELVAWLHAHPGEGYAIPGVGSSPHLVGEMINRRFGLQLQQVPYRSGGPALADLLGGHVRVMVDNIVTALPPYADGRIHALGIAASERSPVMPDVPTLNEAFGVDDLDLTSWQGLFGPARLPAPIVARLAEAFAAALALPEIRERMLKFGSTPVSSTPTAFADFVRREHARWVKLAIDSGARLD